MQLFQPDNELPATRILFDTEALAARIRPWFDNAPDFKLSIANIRYKPHTSCLVTYLMENDDGQSYVHIKAFQSHDWQTRKRKLIQKNRDCLIDDEFAFALFRFPFDTDLPGIEQFLVDPNTFLSRIFFENSPHDQFTGHETLAYKPNRRFTARLSRSSGVNLVLKIHNATTFERALHSADILKKSWGVKTPGRVGRSNRYRALVHNWIAGSECDVSKKNVSECDELMEMIFDFLDRLHRPFADRKRKLLVQSPHEGLGSIAEYLAKLCPPLATTARRLADEIKTNLPTGGPSTLVHGDFHERQVILSQNGVQACDFDNCCLGDPTSDLGNFLGHLHYRACLNEVPMDRVLQITKRSIKHISDNGDGGALARFLWNQIAAMFRLSTHSFRSGREDWVERTEEFLKQLADQIAEVRAIIRAKSTVASYPQTKVATALTQDSPDTDYPTTLISAKTIKNDEKFKFLAGAFNLPLVEHVLKQQVPKLTDLYGNFEIAKVLVRRYKPGRRCLLEYELATDSGIRSILGKASAKRLDRKTLDAQSELFNHHSFGYDNVDQVSVPRPLGFCRQWKMWFQEKVNASPGIALLRDNKLTSVAGQIAHTLAKLHASDFSPVKRHSNSDEIRILDDRLNRFADDVPHEAYRVNRIRKNCAAICREIDAKPEVPIHRDFYHDQIMFSNQRTFLVDLDLISLGHPLLDVGNFLAHLTEHGIRKFDNAEHWRQAENGIVKHYLARMPQHSERDIVAFKAISFARHIYISWTKANRRKRIESVIETAEQLTTDLIANTHFAKTTER